MLACVLAVQQATQADKSHEAAGHGERRERVEQGAAVLNVAHPTTDLCTGMYVCVEYRLCTHQLVRRSMNNTISFALPPFSVFHRSPTQPWTPPLC